MKHLIWIWLFVLSGILMAQESTVEPLSIGVVDARFSSNVTKPRLGEPFTLILEVSLPDGAVLEDWIELDNRLYPIEILSVGDIQTVKQRDSTLYRQEFQAVVWAVGTYISPELTITYTYQGSTEKTLIRSLSLNVPRTLTEFATTDLRPSVPVVDLPYIPPYVYLAMGGVMAILTYLGWQIVKRRNGRFFGTIGGDQIQGILADLEDLKQTSLASEDVYLLIADKIRQYLYLTLNLNTLELTTSELLEMLQLNGSISTPLLRKLQSILNQTDLVKFAKFKPDENLTRFIEFAIRWIMDAEQGRQTQPHE